MGWQPAQGITQPNKNAPMQSGFHHAVLQKNGTPFDVTKYDAVLLRVKATNIVTIDEQWPSEVTLHRHLWPRNDNPETQLPHLATMVLTAFTVPTSTGIFGEGVSRGALMGTTFFLPPFDDQNLFPRDIEAKTLKPLLIGGMKKQYPVFFASVYGCSPGALQQVTDPLYPAPQGQPSTIIFAGYPPLGQLEYTITLGDNAAYAGDYANKGGGLPFSAEITHDVWLWTAK